MEPVKQNVVKTAAEKAPIKRASAEKTAAEKTAAMSVMDIAKSHVIGGLAGVAAAAIGNAAIGKAQQLLAQPAFKRSLDKAISLNPRLQQRPRAELDQYMELIIEASPSVAKNPLLLANYLEFLLDHQGQLNYNGYTSLVNLESQIISNRNNANPLSSAVQKSIVENTIRGAFDSKRKLDDNALHAKYRGEYEEGLDHMRTQFERDRQRAYNQGVQHGVKYEDLGALV